MNLKYTKTLVIEDVCLPEEVETVQAGSLAVPLRYLGINKSNKCEPDEHENYLLFLVHMFPDHALRRFW
jgi:hypothetical protein